MLAERKIVGIQLINFINPQFVASFQDSKKYRKKKKVAWLVMSSAVLLQVTMS